MFHAKRLLLVLCASIAVTGLVACGSSDSSTGNATTDSGSENAEETSGGAKPAATTIVIKNGEPVGGVQELEYSAGDQIEFSVDSDVADEIHVHGYDLMKDVPAGGSVSFSFPAEIEGIFEVELEEHGVQIGEIRVNP